MKTDQAKQNRPHDRKRKQDPHAAREARNYTRPIPSREAILNLLEEEDRPLDFAAIARGLGLHEETDLEALRRRLGAMVRDGQLVQNRRDDYCLADRVGIVTGTVIGHREGFGFLSPDDNSEDLFLSPRQMRSLMHGDRAAMRVRGVDQRGRREGSLVDVLERRTTELVGRYFVEQGIGLVAPDNSRYSQDVLVPDNARNGAQPGQIVIVEITEQPTKRSQPIGRIIKVLGDHRAAGMEVEIAIHSHGLPHEWPRAMEDEMRAFGSEVPEAAKRGREDLRDVPLVTIDGADARDFDDAVFCEPRNNGWRLIVAIADVSHYVRPGTALDDEAHNRATSVYFPDWVIPMLPEGLSNGLCSLNPQVDRLCMGCEMHVTADGKVGFARFFEGVMRSAARQTYDDVGAVLDGDIKLNRRYEKLVPQLRHLHDLYRALRKARERRGAIDFDKPETKIVFGPERKIDEIVPVVRNDAHKMIEEFMIAANVSAAVFLAKHKIPTLFRVHDDPDPDRVEAVREFLRPLGLSLGGGKKPQPEHYARLLQQIRERPDRHLVETVLLRSLAQAMYSPDNSGHFGLAHQAYLHFTSPIRRYPDLLVHRAIRHVLRGGRAAGFEYGHKDMETLGHHCSMSERRADEATRDAVTSLKCEYMLDKVGQEFEGMITGVTGFGLFVELDGIYAEGLVHVTSLSSDYYHHDATGHRLVGERTGREYRLSDRIRVRVLRVNLDERKIDFEPVERAPAHAAPPAGRKGKRRKRRGK